jgi:hypothetical protein
MSTTERNKIMKNFQAEDEVERMKNGYGDPPNHDPDQHYMLFTTMGLSGYGVSFTRAQTAVIWEPSWKLSDVKQACARIVRIGQENEETWTYLLFTEDSPIEVAIMHKQKARALF